MGCSFCPRAFMYKSDLQRHVRTHTGERPYTCSHCPYRASQKSHLLEHVKRRHRSLATSTLVVPGALLVAATSPATSGSLGGHILHTPVATASSTANSSSVSSTTTTAAAHAQLLYTVTGTSTASGSSQPTAVLYSTVHSPQHTVLHSHGSTQSLSVSTQHPVSSSGSQHASSHHHILSALHTPSYPHNNTDTPHSST